MRHEAVYDEDDFADSGAELSLGMGTLIGIFFGLALVCGVFFGFGYMLGHRTPGPYVSSDPLYVASKTAQEPIAPKPSALIASEPSNPSRVVVPIATPTSATVTEPQIEQKSAPRISANQAIPAAPPAPPKPTPAVIERIAPPPAVLQPALASVVASGTIMVQIAAVKNRSDAEALANAVRKDGFNPEIRTEPKDKLLHVQVGPFANRDDAKVMRQKLSSAGYDAFIK